MTQCLLSFKLWSIHECALQSDHYSHNITNAFQTLTKRLRSAATQF